MAATPAEPPVVHEAPAKKLALVESPAAPARKPALAEAAPPQSRKAPPTEGPAATSVAKKSALLPHPVAVAVPSSSKATPGAGAAAPKTVGLAAKPAALPAAKATVASTAEKAPAAPPHAPTKGNFLLQLSSFQDRAEADAFARRFAGQNAYVVASEVPGKGLWYRVRVGSYGTMKDATAAKTAFEHEHGVIAYVAGTGPSQ